MTVLPCPRCGKEVESRYSDTDQNTRRYYFKCKRDSCRNHFRAVKVEGLPMQVTNMSPPDRRTPSADVNLMGCPNCGAYGKIKTTMRRRDGYWRRHQCMACGPYYTCEPIANEMGVTVHKRLPSLISV